MLHKVTLRAWAIAACGGLLAGPAAAVALGQARGAALLGRPLELAVPLALQPGEGDDPCASGDVFYGDAKVQRGVAVRWERRGPSEGVLHVSSTQPVDEPMVTLYLRVGCGQAVTRRYVLLSEVPPATEPTARALPPAAMAVPAVPAPAGRPEAEPRRASPAPVVRKAQAPAPAPAVRSAPPRRGPAAAPAPAHATGGRLRLEPLDLTIEREPTLQLTRELTLPSAVDPQKRQAAAALWAALQKAPEAAAQEAERMQAVQGEVQQLRALNRENAAAVAQMRGQVEQAHSTRSQATLLVAVLSAILAALLAWVGWRAYRNARVQRVERWFEVNGEATQPRDTAAPSPGPATAPPQPQPLLQPETTPTPLAPARSLAPPGAALEFQASRGGAQRMVGVDELIDLHDKIDFFVAIGEYDQAIALLERHVHDDVETSALAWLDLLQLYHARGRRAEYGLLRVEFQHRFVVQVPDFDHFDQPTASLENYGRALSRIVALWPSRRVLDVIEESIFRKPGLPGAEPFSLEAYRELVLLYQVAKEVAPAEALEAEAAAPDAILVDPPAADRERLLVPPATGRVGLDIDLGDEAAPPEPVFAPAAEAQAPASPGGGRELPPLDFDISAFGPDDDRR